jgi:hypothetical protein
MIFMTSTSLWLGNTAGTTHFSLHQKPLQMIITMPGTIAISSIKISTSQIVQSFQISLLVHPIHVVDDTRRFSCHFCLIWSAMQFKLRMHFKLEIQHTNVIILSHISMQSVIFWGYSTIFNLTITLDRNGNNLRCCALEANLK